MTIILFGRSSPFGPVNHEKVEAQHHGTHTRLQRKHNTFQGEFKALTQQLQ